MIPSTMRDRLCHAARAAAVTVFWIAVWEGLSRLIGEELLLPSPGTVAAEWLRLCTTVSFWTAAALSLLRVLGGFAAALLCGSLLAMLTSRFRILRVLLAPLLHVVRAAPVASFIILALVWIRSGLLPLFISFLMVVPLVWDAVEQGIRQTDPALLEMARAYRLSRGQIFRHIRFPSVLPYLLTAMTTGVGFAWKSAVAAEVICRPAHSIGDYLYAAKMYLETPAVFAWTATAVLLSVGLTALLRRLTASLRRRYTPEKEAA